jgi:hypothetical protein
VAVADAIGTRRLLIGGEWRGSAGDETIDVTNPATGEVLGSIPAGHREDADAAVRAARAAHASWAGLDASQRAAPLKSAARSLRAHLDELAEIQTLENGKPLGDSRGGAEAGVEAIEQYAELGPLHRGRSLAGSRGATDMMVDEPRGVAALVVPWNDPVAIACGQIGAALVTGNTGVFKPPEKTPLSRSRSGLGRRASGFRRVRQCGPGLHVRRAHLRARGGRGAVRRRAGAARPRDRRGTYRTPPQATSEHPPSSSSSSPKADPYRPCRSRLARPMSGILRLIPCRIASAA